MEFSEIVMFYSILLDRIGCHERIISFLKKPLGCSIECFSRVRIICCYRQVERVEIFCCGEPKYSGKWICLNYYGKKEFLHSHSFHNHKKTWRIAELRLSHEYHIWRNTNLREKWKQILVMFHLNNFGSLALKISYIVKP